MFLDTNSNANPIFPEVLLLRKMNLSDLRCTDTFYRRALLKHNNAFGIQN